MLRGPQGLSVAPLRRGEGLGGARCGSAGSAGLRNKHGGGSRLSGEKANSACPPRHKHPHTCTHKHAHETRHADGVLKQRKPRPPSHTSPPSLPSSPPNLRLTIFTEILLDGPPGQCTK